MANMTFNRMPPVLGKPSPLMTNAKPAMQKPYPVPGGRPATDFGGMYAKPAPVRPPQYAPEVNDLAPAPVGGMTGARTKPYDPRMGRFGMREPIR